jgi:P2 family phage contractile tail tube protein
MSIQINRLTNANVWVDGVNHLGQIDEITLPTVSHKMVEHKALGMVGSSEFFAGIDKMEAKIKWNSYYGEALRKSANPVQSVKLQVRGNIEVYTAEGRTNEVKFVCFLTCQYKGFPLGNFKQHDNVELESNLAVYACRMEIGNEEIVEIDVLANIYKVAGEDILAQYRINLGI